ncbi:MAG: hypothetical protein ACMVO5_08960 [Polymorphobacter sp.]|uniref:hypothetical protein n=1 Tax=Polymorphobacter sp. TaxID=1909290 RepID=UPI003A8C8505
MDSPDTTLTADAPVTDAAARAAVADLSTYKWGFSSDIEQDFAPKGLNEDIVRFISAKKGEPEWLLEWRLKAYRRWLTHGKPRLGQAQHRADRLSGRLLLRRSKRASQALVAR